MVGTQGTLNTVVKCFSFESIRIYNESESWSIIGMAIPSGNTYNFTYYQDSDNPFGSVYPSYTMETQATKEIPLSNNIEVFIVFSQGAYSATGTFYMPSTMSDGQCVTFKDYKDASSTSNISLNATTGKTIDGGNASVPLNTNGLVKRYVFVDSLLELIGLKKIFRVYFHRVFFHLIYFI